MSQNFHEQQKQKETSGEWDVVFVGCSAMRATGPRGFIDRCERELGRVGCHGNDVYMVTSSQASMWHAVHYGKIPLDEVRKVEGYGKLFQIEHSC